jgi:GTPase SAR1 family protein
MLFWRFAEKRWDPFPTLGIGLELQCVPVKVEATGVTYTVDIWDYHAGWSPPSPHYFRKTHIFFLCYSITDSNSFSKLRDWMTLIQTHAQQEAIIVIVGLKADLEKDRVVSTQDTLDLADSLELPFFEISSQSGSGCEELLQRVCHDVDAKILDGRLDVSAGQNPHGFSTQSSGIITSLNSSAPPSSVNNWGCGC